MLLHTMENETLKLNNEHKVLIDENKDRIQRLFGVQVDTNKNESGICICRLLPANCHAQENTIKAKNYINALTASGKGFSVTTETYDLDIVNMVIAHRDGIEKQSAAVISASAYSNTIKIQGQLGDIMIAKNVIEQLVHQIPGKSNVIHSDTDGGNPNIEQNLPNFSAIGHPGILNDNVNLHSVYHNEQPHDIIDTDSVPDMSSEENIKRAYDQLGIHTAVAQLKLSSQLSDNSDSEDDDEEVIQEIHKDPEYHSKVEFALKLGYHESDLLEALKKLGATAGQNELLSELIKQGATSGDKLVSTKDESMAFSPENIEEVPEFTFERKKMDSSQTNNLRHIILDGSNVAMSHGNKEVFSCRGIQLAVDWFRQRGHNDITVFVPQWRKETSRSDARIKDQGILNQLEKEKVLVFTPARRIGGKRVVCYDDRYILKLAVETDGIVVSNDNYRDLLGEKEEFKKVIEERLLMFSFVNDRFMPPDDPLGRSGPTLDNFLQKEHSQPEPLPPPCPYGSKKCTYGNKCKYYHPERRNQPHKTVTEKLAEQAKQRMQEMRERDSQSADGKKKLTCKASLQRTQSFNPGDLGRQDSVPFLQGSMSGSASNLCGQEDDRYAIYNQKMAENLRKMLQEQTKPVKENQPKTPEKKETQFKSNLRDNSGTIPSPPRWTGSGVDNLRYQGRCSPRGTSPRGASPVSNLVVPGQGQNFEDGEQFLSGHLLLAKKLSDEANECDKMKKRGSDLNDWEFSHGAGTKYQFKSAGGDFHNSQSQSSESSKQKLKHPVAKQKLSRQLSLQGQEDPRLRRTHQALQAQFSYDPRRVVLGQPILSHDLEEGNSLLQDFIQGQSHENLSELNDQNIHGHSISGFNQLANNEMSSGHASLSRMQSAPDPFVMQKQQSHKARLVRQNSSSDTQLNKLETADQTYGHFTNSVASRGMYSDTMLSRGTLPMKDTTGSVTFQIGGPPPRRQMSTPYRSIGSVNQNFQQYNPMEYPYQQHQQQQQQQPSHLQHQQFGIPFENLQQPGMLFMDSNQMMQQSMPPTFSRQVSTGFMPSQNVQGQGHKQYFDQSNIWADNPQNIASSVPQNYGNMNMHGTTSGQSMSPNRPVTSITPPSTSSSCGSMYQHMQQQPLPSPLPADAPILEADPRYKVYFHLCGLFPEDKVRAVMNKHPEAESPSDICAYIIGAK